MKVGILFSGGKDSSYVCWKAMQTEEVVCLITIRSHNEESYMFHTPNIHLTALQAEAAGIPLIEVITEGIEENELKDLTRALKEAQQRFGIEGVVTGAILSVYQATRIQKICHYLDIWCFNPLWHCDQRKYMNELVLADFRVIIAGVFSEPFDDSWLGREIDNRMITELDAIAGRYGITLTGEGGELETFVTDAPFFRQRIVIRDSQIRYRNHNGRFLITDAILENK